jgi:hypothetical protein
MHTQLCNDSIGSRNIQHINVLVVRGQGLVQFKGESIPPVARVTKEEYTKNGKWSHTTWTVELTDEANLIPFKQDWGIGKYFPVTTWQEAIKRVREADRVAMDGVTDTMIETFIRATFPKVAENLNAADATWRAAGDVFGEMIAAQAELAQAHQEVVAYVAIQEASIKAAGFRAALELAKGGKMSLADLKAAINN